MDLTIQLVVYKVEAKQFTFKAKTPQNQAILNRTVKALVKYNNLNNQRDFADNDGDEKLYRKLNRQCEIAFDKYLELAEGLPKYERVKLENSDVYLHYAKGGGVDNKAYFIVKFGFNGDDGYQVVESKPILAQDENEAAAMLKDQFESLEGMSCEIISVKNQSKMAKGGGLEIIENQYLGKSPKQVYEMWNYGQKYEFFKDHFATMGAYSNNEYKQLPSKKYDQLDEISKNALKSHIMDGQYAKGGVTEHGLRKGDTIIDDMFWANEAIIKDVKGVKHKVDLDKGKRYKKGGNITYKGIAITKEFPSGYFTYYSNRNGRFLKADTLDGLKKQIDKENMEKGGKMEMGGSMSEWCYSIGGL